MYVEEKLMMGIVEEALGMKADGEEEWCISWLEWFWQQEIERAICSIRQGES
ncbi:MAG: hypothetical protein ACYS14_08820 [Planctomycetota bacterium]|jgi:hypothetical protein